jgi:hypothetical protein
MGWVKWSESDSRFIARVEVTLETSQLEERLVTADSAADPPDMAPRPPIDGPSSAEQVPPGTSRYPRNPTMQSRARLEQRVRTGGISLTEDGPAKPRQQTERVVYTSWRRQTMCLHPVCDFCKLRPASLLVTSPRLRRVVGREQRAAADLFGLCDVRARRSLAE